MSDDACYRAMDFLLDAIDELQETVFFAVANLLNLEVDLLFFDTTSTYWQTDRLPEELVEDTDDEQDSDDRRADHGRSPLVEAGQRAYSKHSKDHRPDLPQVVIGMAVTREGIPVRTHLSGGWTDQEGAAAAEGLELLPELDRAREVSG
jgi:hypothetical protein